MRINKFTIVAHTKKGEVRGEYIPTEEMKICLNCDKPNCDGKPCGRIKKFKDSKKTLKNILTK